MSVYQLSVQTTLEFAAPVFHSSLSQDLSRHVEMVQKKAFAIILVSYESVLETLQLERLDARRESLSHNFALNCTKSSKQNTIFPLNTNFRENMRHTKKFKEKK